MRCDAFDRWLDEGMPEARSEEAHAHAGGCPACAARLAAARAVEASLSMAPPAAPAGFTAAVLARIEALERPATAEPGHAAPRTAPWWVVVGSEPAVWIGLGTVPALLALPAFTPRLRSALAGVAEAAVSAWMAGGSAWASRIPALLPPLDPTERTALAAGLALPLLWLCYRAPIWMAETWSRKALASSRARGSRPRSPR